MKHKYNNIQNRDLSLIFSKTIGALRKVVIGQGFQLDLFLSCLLVGEHVALVGESGVGKTHMMKKFIEFFRLDQDFESITGHPEVMPQDFSVKHFMQNNDIRTKRIALQKAKIFFVDEFNRISPKSLNILLDPLNDGTLHDEINDRRIKLGLNLSAKTNSASIMDDDVVEGRRHAFDDVRKQIKEETSPDDKGKMLITYIENLHSDYVRRLNETSSELDKKKQILGAILKDGVFKESIEEFRNTCNQLEYKEDKNEKKSSFEEKIKDYTLNVVLKANEGSYSTVKEKVLEIEKSETEKENLDFKVKAAKQFDSYCKAFPPNLEGLTQRKLLLEAERLEQNDFTDISGDHTVIRNMDEDEYFFICILASNPTSRGGNFPPPDALLDRLGMEIRFDPLDAEKKAQIPDQSKIVQILEEERKEFQKSFADTKFAAEIDFFDRNTRFFHFLHHLKKRLSSTQEADEAILRKWCKEFLGSLVPAKQFIFEFLSKELKSFYIDTVNQTTDYASLHQFAWQWASDVDSELIEVAQSKFDTSKIMNVFKKFDLKKKILDSFNHHVIVIDQIKGKEGPILEKPFERWSNDVFAYSEDCQTPIVIHIRKPSEAKEANIEEAKKTLQTRLEKLGLSASEIKNQIKNLSYSRGLWKMASWPAKKNKWFEKLISDKDYPKKNRDTVQAILQDLVNKLVVDLEFISTIVVGTSGRMVNSLERLVKSFAFIDTAQNINWEELGDQDTDLIPTFRENREYYRRVFRKIGYSATCHRIRFTFGTERSKKWNAINFAVDKAFPKDEQEAAN